MRDIYFKDNFEASVSFDLEFTDIYLEDFLSWLSSEY